MKFLKKNQVIIYVTALMLVVAGYMNFTANGDLKSAVQTASSEEELEKMAKQYNATKEDIQKELGGMDMIKYDIEIRKAFDKLEELNKD